MAEAKFLREAAAEEASFARRVVAAERAAAKRIALEEATAEAAEKANARIVASIVAAEKVASGLASGSGFGRMGGMLEKVTGAIGLASGTGMAAGGLIFAIEAIWPKIDKLIEKMDGASAAAERMQKKVQEANEQMAKFIVQPTEEEETSAKAVKPLLAGQGATKVAEGVEQVLRQRLPPDQRRFLEQYESATAAGVEQAPYITEQAEDLQKQIHVQRASIMKDLMAGRPPAISEVSGMAFQAPGLFPVGTEQRFRQALPENIEAAKKQSDRAKSDSEWAETEYANREEHDKQEREAHKEAVDEKEKLLKEADDNLKEAARTQVRLSKEWEKTLDKDEKEADRQHRESEREREKAEHKAKQDAEHRARENMPEAREHRELAAERNQVMAEAQRQNAMRRRWVARRIRRSRPGDSGGRRPGWPQPADEQLPRLHASPAGRLLHGPARSQDGRGFHSRHGHARP